MKKTKVIHLRIDEALFDLIQNDSIQTFRTFSNMVVYIINEHYKNKAKESNKNE